MFQNMKVGTKIAGGFIIALVITIIIGALSVYYLNSVGKIVNRLATQEIPETSAVVETEREMWKTHVLSYEFDIKLDEQSKKEWFDQRDKIGNAIDKIVPIATALNHQETLKAANGFKQGLSEYGKIAENYTSLAMENEEIEKQMGKTAAGMETPWLDYINGQNEKIQKSIANKNFEDVAARVTKLKLSNAALDLYNLIRKNEYLYMMHQRQEYADILNESIRKMVPLIEGTFKLSHAAEDMKLGDLVTENCEKYKKLMVKWIANKKTQVELLKQSDAAAMGIVDLATKTALQADKDAYDIGVSAVTLLSNVRLLLIVLLISAILIGSALSFFITRGITKPLNRVIEGLNEGADQVASASAQVSSASQSLAEGASEQAASIEETSSSLEEISSMTKQNAENAKQANNLMLDTNEVVGKANESMNALTSSMEEISKASEETSKIIKTIDEIAFQTNLLALNAAVEAARAGEAGAGFAVVADEVRNLAMRAADAAKNTAALIEGTVKKVNDGSGLVTRTNEAFAKVADSSSKVGQLVAEIAAASNEQSQGIDQVNQAVNDMDKVTQQNAANAEESASASEEMNAQAEQMKGAVNELVNMVGSSGNGKEVEVKHSIRHHDSRHKLYLSQRKALPEKMKEVTAQKIIPMDENDFTNF